jgi:predicted ATP-dependent protease
MIEFGVRLAGRRNKVTARFADLADLAREACYVAREVNESPVTASHVRRAREARVERHNLIETKIREMIEDGTILIDVEGSRIGQVNGLSVAEIGGYAFGKPVRITASAALGKAGLINIEREANMSGRLHDKGMQIIAGFLRGRFAQDKPLSLAASLCFEQSYGGVDGDSASATEIFALLSALSGLPIRQDIAVTGSVNQQGDIQPIGGVIQKIEGFFDVCRALGMNGKQGVIIPSENVEDLMLRDDVIDAVISGKFHIYPVATVEQGIAILTGVKAGARVPGSAGNGNTAELFAIAETKKLVAGRNGDSAGAFEPDTVFAFVDQRLHEWAHALKDFG